MPVAVLPSKVAPVKLHWSPRSPFVRKVMVFAHETGLADRLELVRTPVAMKQPNPALMRDNPLSKIPTLITDDGGTLFDSLVICEYLDGLHRGRRLFPDAPARWTALRWHALGNGLTDALILWHNERLRSAEQRSSELMDAFGVKTRATLALLDREADEIAAANLSIGHVGVACALGYIDFRFSELNWRNGHDRIARWFAGFAERPSMRSTIPMEG